MLDREDVMRRHQERQELFKNLNIDTATQNCLHRGGIFDYEELVRRSGEIHKFRHIGRIRLARVYAALRAMGYTIKEL